MRVAAKWINERLWPWQRRWIADRSPYKITRKPRQIGMTEASCFGATLHCLRHPGHRFYLTSTTVMNAKNELLDVVRNRVIPVLYQDPDLRPFLARTIDNDTMIELANGSRLIATANEPARLRGKNRCSYLFEEAAFWPKRVTDHIEDAAFPQIRSRQNPAGSAWVVSTPWFVDTWYHGIWTNEGDRYSKWSRHDVDFLQAAPIIGLDPEEVRKSTTHDGWLTEYLRQFKQGGGNYFDRERLLQCEHSYEGSDPVFIGVDLAKVNDFTSVVVLRRTAKGWHVERVYYMRSVDYRKQAEEIAKLMRQHRPVRTTVDITAHKSFVDLLEMHVDGFEIRGKAFTNPFKVDYTEQIKDDVSADLARFCFNDQMNWQDGKWAESYGRQLLNDLVSVVQDTTPGGKATYTVPRTRTRDDEGHGDGWSALMCALEAASTPRQTVKVVKRTRRKMTNFT